MAGEEPLSLYHRITLYPSFVNKDSEPMCRAPREEGWELKFHPSHQKLLTVCLTRLTLTQLGPERIRTCTDDAPAKR